MLPTRRSTLLARLRRRAGLGAMGLLAGLRRAESRLHLPAARRRRGQDFVVARHVGERRLADATKVAVFVHFDPAGRVHDYVFHLLDALRGAGLEIVFVTNGPAFDERALPRLLPRCAAVLRRRNVGYDFAAYHDGIAALGDLARYDIVILANDSVYGPLSDLSAVLSRCDESAAAWGMTDSWSGRFHLQSYFLLLRAEALRHPAFAQFWRDLLPIQSKHWIIQNYEIGFTQAMLAAGLRCAALFAYRDAARAMHAAAVARLAGPELGPEARYFLDTVRGKIEAGEPLNAMHHFWDVLIAELGCPFIKRELLAGNPGEVATVGNWERIVREAGGYDPNLIVRHLQSIGRDRAP